MKRVLSIGLDIEVEDSMNGDYLAEVVAGICEDNGFTVMATTFHEDVTVSYEK